LPTATVMQLFNLLMSHARGAGDSAAYKRTSVNCKHVLIPS